MGTDQRNEDEPNLLDLAGLQLRWPREGDRLLQRSDDWNTGVEFSEQPIDRHVHIWSGYMRGGAALVEACRRELQDRHFLIYPILANYRQGLELAMKWVIEVYGPYADISLSDVGADHNLLKLWKATRTIIEKLGSGDSGVALLVVERIVTDFHELDAAGTAFRYSTNKNGAVIRLPDVLLNIENIRDVMEGVDNFFSGVDGQLDNNTGAIDQTY